MLDLGLVIGNVRLLTLFRVTICGFNLYFKIIEKFDKIYESMIPLTVVISRRMNDCRTWSIAFYNGGRLGRYKGREKGRYISLR